MFTKFCYVVLCFPQWLKFGIRDLQTMLLSTYEFHEIRLMEGHIFRVSLNDNCDVLKLRNTLVKSVYYFTGHTTVYTSHSYVTL